MEEFMNKILQSMAMLVLALASLVGCDGEPRSAVDTNPARVAELQQTFRDLWLGHIYWVQHATLNSAPNSLADRNAAEKEVVTNTKQIASTVTPFYGEARSEKLFSLLGINYNAVREYSEATAAGNKNRQDAALARLASNADDIAVFLNEMNPFLPIDTVRGLIAAHGAHHVLQINLYKNKNYEQLEATWPMMREHVYVIADTLTTALVKQFPSEFS
jgi:hypothetical protein